MMQILEGGLRGGEKIYIKIKTPCRFFINRVLDILHFTIYGLLIFNHEKSFVLVLKCWLKILMLFIVFVIALLDSG